MFTNKVSVISCFEIVENQFNEHKKMLKTEYRKMRD